MCMYILTMAAPPASARSAWPPLRSPTVPPTRAARGGEMYMCIYRYIDIYIYIYVCVCTY